MVMGSKYTHLLEDADVKRWFENLAAKSIVTATVYLRTLGFYCELNRTDPKAILKAAKRARLSGNHSFHFPKLISLRFII